MKTKFDLQTAIEKWCTENGHDGFYLNDRNCIPCCCQAGAVALCGVIDSILDGDCVGGKLSTEPFVNDDGDECYWSIQPHEEGTE